MLELLPIMQMVFQDGRTFSVRRISCALKFIASMMSRGKPSINWSSVFMVTNTECNAYNITQLVAYVNEIFENHMKQRILHVALTRRITQTTYHVESDKEYTQYEVFLQLGLCDLSLQSILRHVAYSEIHSLK
ncbi:hypothetical protein Pcinc_015052 [Petrolisthes cinctipes]|uniref:Uncharacterized protein n=1 Tax=Petrolisthes cinctipes TaxID=88211 RepID=A0AAE1KSL5_PETCI|nr:hypothetical protein Pcinc_015052 [Petrolisthes cinctipes]